MSQAQDKMVDELRPLVEAVNRVSIAKYRIVLVSPNGFNILRTDPSDSAAERKLIDRTLNHEEIRNILEAIETYSLVEWRERLLNKNSRNFERLKEVIDQIISEEEEEYKQAVKAVASRLMTQSGLSEERLSE